MNKNLLLLIVNLVSAVSPQTRMFRLRARAYRWCGIDLGPGVRLNGRVRIQYANVKVGAGTWIGSRTEIVSTAEARVSIGENCDISQDVLLVCGTHEIGSEERRAGRGISEPIHIGDGCWIGARATILYGSSIGRGSVVAAGSLVRGTFPDNVIIAGAPARILRRL